MTKIKKLTRLAFGNPRRTKILGNKNQKVILVAACFFVMLAFFAPSLAAAQSTSSDCANLYIHTGGTTTNGQAINIGDGLPQFCTTNALYQKIITVTLAFAGSIAVLFIIIGGFLYLTSAGNEEQSEKAKKTLINSVIGLVVIIMAAAIVHIIVQLITSNPTTSTSTTTTQSNP